MSSGSLSRYRPQMLIHGPLLWLVALHLKCLTSTGTPKADTAEMERSARVKDDVLVDRQLGKYVDEGILDVDHSECDNFGLDLLR